MPLPVHLVIPLGIGNEPTTFKREVNTKCITITQRTELVFLHLKRLGRVAVFGALVNHIFESPAEIGIARCLQSRFKCNRGTMAVTSYTQRPADEPMEAVIGCMEIHNPLLMKYETV